MSQPEKSDSQREKAFVKNIKQMLTQLGRLHQALEKGFEISDTDQKILAQLTQLEWLVWLSEDQLKEWGLKISYAEQKKLDQVILRLRMKNPDPALGSSRSFEEIFYKNVDKNLIRKKRDLRLKSFHITSDPRLKKRCDYKWKFLTRSDAFKNLQQGLREVVEDFHSKIGIAYAPEDLQKMLKDFCSKNKVEPEEIRQYLMELINLNSYVRELKPEEQTKFLMEQLSPLLSAPEDPDPIMERVVVHDDPRWYDSKGIPELRTPIMHFIEERLTPIEIVATKGKKILESVFLPHSEELDFEDRWPKSLDDWKKERMKHPGWSNKRSNLILDAYNKKENTILIKLHLDRQKEDLRRDFDFLLDLLEFEAELLNVDLSSPKKSRWDVYDKFLQVYDMKKQNPKMNRSEIAEKLFPDDKYKNPNKNGRKEYRMPLWALENVRHYQDEADKMINKGGWRQI